MNSTGIFRGALFSMLLVLTTGNALPLPAQQPESSGAKLNVDARQVDVPVVVHDKKGSLVQNLTKDNFTLQVDGHPQTIQSFQLDPDLPLTLGLLIDSNIGQPGTLDDVRIASVAFLDDMLTHPADRDKAFVVQFARQTDLLQDVTSSKAKLQAALKQLNTSGSGGRSGDTSSVSAPGDSDSARGRRGGTTLYDAMFLSSDEVIGKQRGRKALILVSDGVDSGSRESLTSTTEAVQRADTLVYAIYFKGKDPDRGFHAGNGDDGGGYPGDPNGYPGGGYPGGGYPGGGYPGGGYPGGGYPGGQRRQPQGIPLPDGKKILEHVVKETGGRLFEVSKRQTIADIYKQIGEELRAQYRLAFTSDEKAVSDGYHRIDLSLTKSAPKDLSIQTREGYYTGQETP
jgi:VWFA-related protein